MAEPEVEGLDNKTSKYNSAIAQLIRLDILWKECNKHCSSGNYAQWNIHLDRIWSELAGDTKKDDDEERTYKDFTSKLATAGKFSNNKLNGFTNNSIDPTIMAKHYVILIEKEIWLRRLQNKQRKGTAYDDEDDFPD